MTINIEKETFTLFERRMDLTDKMLESLTNTVKIIQEQQEKHTESIEFACKSRLKLYELLGIDTK